MASINRRDCVLTLAASMLGPNAYSQTSRVFTIIIPQPAGNPSDVFARKLQPHLQHHLGQSVVIENITGAGGAIGIQKMLNSAPDSWVSAMVSPTEPILTPLSIESVKYQPEDMKPVGFLGFTSYVLVGNKNLPARNHTELLALAKQRQTQGKPLSFAHIGNGSMIHLLGANWGQLCGIDLIHAPYRGVPPAVQDVVGGQIDLTFVPLGGLALDLINSGKLATFGSTSDEKITLLPTIAPLMAQTPLLKDFVYQAWGTLLVSTKMPQTHQEKLQQAFAQAMQAPDVREFIQSQGTDPHPPLSLMELDQLYKKETQKYQRLAKQIDLTRA
jgi:tripartite-type tricarboxylate transporter receptor subunit TctC